MRLRKTFANNSSANIKLSKTELHKIEQSGTFLGRLLEALLKHAASLAKRVLIPLALTAAEVTDEAIQKKTFRLDMTTLIFSNEEMNDIMKIVRSLEDPSWLIKRLAEQLKMKQKTREKTKVQNRAGKEIIRKSQNF